MWVPWTAAGGGARGRRQAGVFRARGGRSARRGGRTLENERSVRADEHGARAGTADRARTAFGVDGNVARDDERVAAVPAARLDPVARVEEGGRAAVARVLRVDALDVRVAREQVHQDRLDRLALVDERLGADVDAADRRGRDVVLLEERLGHCAQACEGQRRLVEGARLLLVQGLVARARLRRPPSLNSSVRAILLDSSAQQGEEGDEPERRNELMSSRSSQNAIFSWPRPIVYLPAATPSKRSRSASSMQRRGKYRSIASARAVGGGGGGGSALAQLRAAGRAGQGRTDADVLRAGGRVGRKGLEARGRHGAMRVGGERGEEGGQGRGGDGVAGRAGRVRDCWSREGTELSRERESTEPGG